jgi:gas vesicle protein
MGQAAEEQLTRDIEARRAELSRDIDALTDKVSPAQIMERRKEATRSRFRSMRDTVMGSAQDTRHSAGSSMSNAADSVTSGAQGAVDTIERRTEGNPLAAGLIAFGAGWLISSLMPTSEKEASAAQKLVKTAKDSPLVEEAKSVGQEMGQNLKESATEAAQEVKGTAQESVDTVKQEGQSSADTVKQEGQERAQHVQQEARDRTS